MTFMMMGGSIICLLLGMMTFTASSATNSAIHEIEALLLFLISALLFSGSAVVMAIGKLDESIAASLSKRLAAFITPAPAPIPTADANIASEPIIPAQPPIQPPPKSWVEQARQEMTQEVKQGR